MRHPTLTRRSFLRSIALGAAALVFAGCTKTGKQAAATDEPMPAVTRTPGKGTRVTCALPGWQGYGPRWSDLVNALLLNDSTWPTDVELVAEELTAWGYEQMLQVRFADGTAPDIMLESDWVVYDDARHGYLLPLDDLVAKDRQFNLADFYPNHLSLARYKDKLFAVPLLGSGSLLCINRDMFREANVKEPTGAWRWDEFREAARKLTKAEAQRWGFGYLQLWSIQERIWQNGGAIYDAERTRCLMDQPAAVEAMRYWADVRFKDKVTPRDTDMYNWDDSAAQFIAGKLAMFETTVDEILTRGVTGVDFEWSVVDLPYQKKAVNSVGIRFLAANAQTPRKAQAWTALKALCTPERLTKLARICLMPVGRQSVNAKKPFAKASIGLNWDLVLKGWKEGQPTDGIPNAEAVGWLIGEMYYAHLAQENANITTILADFIPRINAALIA